MRVLGISLHYPPITGLSPRAMLELARALADLGHVVDVLTVEVPAGHPVYTTDPAELAKVPQQVNVRRIPMGAVNRMAARVLATGRPSDLSGRKAHTVRKGFGHLANRLFAARHLWQAFAIPDASIDWLPSALREARRMIQVNEYDLIVSLGNPQTCHLIAYMAARRKNLPHVPFYIDGWATDPALDSRPAWNRRINRMLELRVLRAAERIVVCAEGVIPHLRQQYGISGDKIWLARLSFVDPQLYESVQETPSPNFHMAYTGMIYEALHDCNPLFNALASSLEGEVRLLVLGPQQEQTRLQAAAVAARNVEFLGRQPHLEAIRAQKSASVLLLFGHRGGQQLPSKVYEYFAARRPILCIAADSEDLAAKLVREHRRGIVVQNSTEEIAAALNRLTQLHRTHDLDSSFCLEELPQYTTARATADLVHGVLG